MQAIIDLWHDLEDMIEILEPSLYDCQVMFESGNAILGYIVQR